MEIIWQLIRFIKTGDWICIYVITGIDKFRQLGILQSEIKTSVARQFSTHMSKSYKTFYVNNTKQLRNLYNKTKYWWMISQ